LKDISADIYILGAGKFAEEIADTVSLLSDFNLKGFVEGIDQIKSEKPLNGFPVYWFEDLCKIKDPIISICAVGSVDRKTFIKKAIGIGVEFANIVHPNSHLSPSVKLGSGIFINSGVIIASHTTIGNHVIVNRGVLVGHHTKIDQFVTISPGVNIAGRVTVGESVYIGMGANIFDNITIGRNSIIGAGSLVTKNVPAGVMVMGLPAKIVKKL
jgi:acetyltransferase EpsM